MQNVADLMMHGGSVPYGGGGVNPVIKPLQFLHLAVKGVTASDRTVHTPQETKAVLV